jgi:AmmeMemoRadiSam system protein A
VTTPALTHVQRIALLDVAADAIRQTLEHGADTPPDPASFDAPLRERTATFVTLERDLDLLGCMGSLEPSRPVVADVARHAVAAAFRDPRLPAVTADDYSVMSIEVSLLSNLEPVAAAAYEEVAAAVRPGTDGLVVETGRHRATFLPAVWRHFGDDAAAFLGALWRKAGLEPGAWPRGTECSRYTAEKLVDPGPRAPLDRG